MVLTILGSKLDVYINGTIAYDYLLSLLLLLGLVGCLHTCLRCWEEIAIACSHLHTVSSPRFALPCLAFPRTIGADARMPSFR
jgi:hypothetical protein